MADALTLAKNYLNRLSLSQKIFLGAAVALTILGILLVVNLAGSLNYGVLYSNLSDKDSGLILEQLKSKKVPYKLDAGGSVIKVPDNLVSELRIELAATGLPEGGGVGFEIFDKSSLSTTDFVQNINYIRAIEGELERTLSGLKEVRSAKVHISLPKKSVFIEEQEESKASIVLSLRPGAQISESLVPAILHLTAQAVEGLKPENIAVVDIQGKLLSRPRSGGDDIFAEMTSTQLAYQKKMEENLSREIIDVLEPHVGSGKVRTNVKLKLNFEKVESTEESVDPDRIAKISEKTETSSTSGAMRAGGVPGVSSNVAQATGGQTVDTNIVSPSKSKSEKSMVNYEVSKKVTHLTKPVGDIQNLSVAVLIDDAVNVRVQDDQLFREPRRRTAEELDSIRKIVQAAVGYNIARGDVIEVVNLPFDNSSETLTEYYQAKEKRDDLINEIIKYGSIILGTFFVLAFIVRPVLRKITDIVKQARMPKPEEIEIPRVDSEKVAALQEARDEADIERELMEKYKVPKSTRKMGFIRQKVKKFAEDNLDEAASLVRSFLIED